MGAFACRQPGYAQRGDDGVRWQSQGHHQLAAVESPAVVAQVQADLRRPEFIAAAGGVMMNPLLENILFQRVLGVQDEQDVLLIPGRPGIALLVFALDIHSGQVLGFPLLEFAPGLRIRPGD
jgi:hypothetical protein